MNNLTNIQNLIAKKVADTPFYPTVADAKSVITDVDHFPYTRFYRGVYNSNVPIFHDRQAGWRVRQDGCYTSQNKPVLENPQPLGCFQPPCSTIFPCKKEKCVITYR